MPAQHTLHVALTEPLVKYIGEQVSSGRYATASEVVRAALRLLIERDGVEPRCPALREQAANE
jgi:antitoxin ParD1/3/4